jgi:adenine phosphoribosyltransferase
LRLEDYIRDIPDFPRPGIVFKDITPLFLSHGALRAAVDALAEYARAQRVDFVVSAEARGFVLGGAVAAAADAGFILARKPGKLPRETDSVEYQLEYGVDALEVHTDAVRGGARLLVHDDLLATGGTAAALCDLVENAGGVVAGCAFVIELAFLRARAAATPRRTQPRGLRRGVTVRGERRVTAAAAEVWRVVADPFRLPAWWPGVVRVEEASPESWTTVLTSGKGKSVRADYTRVAAEEPRRLEWRQELTETPFERILAASGTAIELTPEDGGTRVELELVQRPRGWARFAPLQLRTAARRQVNGALDGLVALLGPVDEGR